jgi:hypothetical protein
MRRAVLGRVVGPVALAVGVMVGSLTSATPAQAAQEVYRTHPCSWYPSVGDEALDCSNRDDHVTVVKYYDVMNGVGRYRVCMWNYHHSGDIWPSTWVAGVVWLNSAGEVVHAPWNPEPLDYPGPGGSRCTDWRAYHASPRIQYYAYKFPQFSWWKWNDSHPV